MLVSTFHGANGLACIPRYGLGDLVQNQDFTCNADYCVGRGENQQQLYMRMQTLLNTFAAAAHFTPLGIDGLLGTHTVEAAVAAAKAMTAAGLPGWDDPSTLQIIGGTTKEQLAILADGFVAALQRANGGAPARASSAPKYKRKLPNWAWWALGGLTTALLVGGVGYIAYRHEAV